MADFQIVVKFYDPYPKEETHRVTATKMHTAIAKAMTKFEKGKRIAAGIEVTVKATRL